MALLLVAMYILFNIVRFYCISGNHRHVFLKSQPTRFIYVTFTHISAMRKGIRSQNSHIRLVSSQGYKAYPAVHSGDAFSCTSPRSAYNGLSEM